MAERSDACSRQISEDRGRGDQRSISLENEIFALAHDQVGSQARIIVKNMDRDVISRCRDHVVSPGCTAELRSTGREPRSGVVHEQIV